MYLPWLSSEAWQPVPVDHQLGELFAFFQWLRKDEESNIFWHERSIGSWHHCPQAVLLKCGRPSCRHCLCWSHTDLLSPGDGQSQTHPHPALCRKNSAGSCSRESMTLGWTTELSNCYSHPLWSCLNLMWTWAFCILSWEKGQGISLISLKDLWCIHQKIYTYSVSGEFPNRPVTCTKGDKCWSRSDPFDSFLDLGRTSD